MEMSSIHFTWLSLHCELSDFHIIVQKKNVRATENLVFLFDFLYFWTCLWTNIFLSLFSVYLFCFCLIFYSIMFVVNFFLFYYTLSPKLVNIFLPFVNIIFYTYLIGMFPKNTLKTIMVMGFFLF